MTHGRRWIVTYTKHLKQKRKTYHDGVLELSDSGNKVLLFDDSEKLIDSRFLKKDEVIESGGTLTFEAHLVDIGSLQEKGPLENLNVSRCDSKSNEKAQTLRQREDEKSMLRRELPHKYLSGTNCRSRGVSKALLSSENKKNTFGSRPPHNRLNIQTNSIKVSKNELDSSGAIQKHDATSTNLKEWNVLYTTQITQKAKKYHDGILRLLLCGSHMNQILLLSEDGSILSSRYLKSVECIRTGNKCELPNHLVEICEPRSCSEEDLKKVPSEQLTRSSCSSNKSTCKARLEQAASSCRDDSVKSTGSSQVQNNKPLRDVCQILHTLKKPFPGEEIDLTKSPAADDNASGSPDFILLEVQNQSKELSLQWVGNSKSDSDGCVTQTSFSGIPVIRSILSQQVTLTEPKLEVDSLAIETSVEGHNISDPTFLSGEGQRTSSDKCCSDVQVSRELSGFMNENLLVGDSCLSNGKEDAADPLGMSCAGTLNTNEVRDQATHLISKEDIEQEGRWAMAENLDALPTADMRCKNVESDQNLSNENFILDDFPTFDLGF